MKRSSAVSLALVLLLAFSLLGGCTQVSDDPAPITSPDASPVTSPDSTSEATPETTPEATDTPEPSDVTPLLWLVTAPDGQIMYLFGSIHAADEALYPLPAYITDAFDLCDALAVEIDMLAFAEDYDAMTSFSLSIMYPEGETLEDEIGAELVSRLVETLTGLGYMVNADLLNGYKPFYWTSFMSNIVAEMAGMWSEIGLDMVFLEEAVARGMQILEVESIEEQLAMSLGFSPPLQAYMVAEALDVEAGVRVLEELYEMWKRGDEQELEAYLFAEADELPDGLTEEHLIEYWDAMNVQRNLKMAEAAERYMAEGKTVFYVVGLMHMLGEDGLVELLRQSGYSVERVL
ncbi:MAG: TraB/GumN family protein [Oscillospiraceae bacterium]|jgi:uncharacterized protein YbaP (TraB family)|nr:TraB/GumN family protein [Oscillospiraceae bacterium]